MPYVLPESNAPTINAFRVSNIDLQNLCSAASQVTFINLRRDFSVSSRRMKKSWSVPHESWRQKGNLCMEDLWDVRLSLLLKKLLKVDWSARRHVGLLVMQIDMSYKVHEVYFLWGLHDLITWPTFGKHENSLLLKNFVSTSWKGILKLTNLSIFSRVSQK